MSKYQFVTYPSSFGPFSLVWQETEARPRVQRVLRAEHQIPRGWVSAYGRIAAHLGVSGGARAVGNALAQNPFPILIPRHRAIRADGSLGGYQGGAAMKRTLREREGLTFSPAGKVILRPSRGDCVRSGSAIPTAIS